MTNRHNSPNRTKINFTDNLPLFWTLQLCFLSLHGKELSDSASQLQFLHLVTRARSFSRPALSLWSTQIKIRFPNCSHDSMFLSSFFCIMPSRTKCPGYFLKQKKSEKICVRREDTKFEGKWSIAKSCGYISQVLWLFGFFLAPAFKSKNSMNILVWEQWRNREK